MAKVNPPPTIENEETGEETTATELTGGTSERGFSGIKFVDRYGHECSLQDSSLATEAAIWFGIDDADPQVCIPGQSWQPVPFPKGTLFATRMHLTQTMVRQLLPFLQEFAETGEYLSRSEDFKKLLKEKKKN